MAVAIARSSVDTPCRKHRSRFMISSSSISTRCLQCLIIVCISFSEKSAYRAEGNAALQQPMAWVQAMDRGRRATSSCNASAGFCLPACEQNTMFSLAFLFATGSGRPHLRGLGPALPPSTCWREYHGLGWHGLTKKFAALRPVHSSRSNCSGGKLIDLVSSAPMSSFGGRPELWARRTRGGEHECAAPSTTSLRRRRTC